MVVLLLCEAVSRPAVAEARPGRVSATLAAAGNGAGGQVEVEADRLEQTREGDLALEGDVTIRQGDSRMQADRIGIRGKRYIEAEGNILLVYGPNRISGARMIYDLKEDTGVIDDAVGQVEPEFYFWAKRVTTRGKEWVELESATWTTCTQPVPYWSFSTGTVKLHVGNYARMWNLRINVGRVPVFYLPFLIWPVKEDRAAGLLPPDFGSTLNRGQVYSQELFIPLGPNADLSLLGRYYTKAGLGTGGEFRMVPNEKGYLETSGFFIDDRVSLTSRYRAGYRQAQEFRKGFRMIADIAQLSDFDFYTDYESDLGLASSPTILGRLDFTRNGDWTSVNIRNLRREQLLSTGTLVQRTLPEIEWRGRSRRIGRTPLFSSFESSAAWIRQYGSSPKIDADYYRADLFPTLSAAISPVPWLDITPSVSYRLTHYTQSRLPAAGSPDVVVVDEPLTRFAGGARLEIVGPKLSRVYGQGEGTSGSKYKHTIESVVSYNVRQRDRRSDEVLQYDEVDQSIDAQNFVTYAIRSRLLARRPRTESPTVPLSYEPILLPDGTTSLAQATVPPEKSQPVGSSPDGAAERPREPVEILSFEIRQGRSFDEPLRSVDLDGDREPDLTSALSNVDATGRFRPNDWADLDLHMKYDVLFRRVSNVSVSGNIRKAVGRVNFSLVRTAGFAGAQDRTQLRLAGDLALLNGRVRIGTDGSYSLNPKPNESFAQDQRWRLELYSQCCGLIFEYLARDFSQTNRRNEFRFSVDLRGIGQVFHQTF